MAVKGYLVNKPLKVLKGNYDETACKIACYFSP